MVGVGWAVLCLWPVVAIFLYRNISLPVALVVTIVGGYLFLPNGIGIDLPVLPPLNKFTIPVFAAFLLTMNAAAKDPQNPLIMKGWLPQNRFILVLLTVLFLSPFATVLTNEEPLVYGTLVLPGLTLYDGFAIMLSSLVVILPFLLGRKVLSSPEGHRTLLTVLVLFALGYSLLALWEVRMSPHLHRQLYGFFPHSFLQQVRAGGFRPIVFLQHGLSVALFFTVSVIAAATLARSTTGQTRTLWVLAMIWLLIVLVLCKSLGPLMICLVLLPVTLLLSTRMQLMAAVCICGVFLSYPLLRSTNVIPVDRVVEFAESIDRERARSLEFRIDNENILLEKALEKPVFGWGNWGRSRVFDERGRDLSVTDGMWLIEFGSGGWVRYIAFFMLLCSPMLLYFLKRRDINDPASLGLMLLLCAKMVDLIPNATIEPFIWMCTGALIGRIEKASWEHESVAQPVPQGGRTHRYARDFTPDVGRATKEKTMAPRGSRRRNDRYSRDKSVWNYRK